MAWGAIYDQNAISLTHVDTLTNNYNNPSCGISIAFAEEGLREHFTIVLCSLLVVCITMLSRRTLQWRHNEGDGVSNHQPHDCLFNHLFRRRSKKTSKLRVTSLCEGDSSVAGEFPAQRPVTRKIFPFDDVIMNMLNGITCVLGTVLISLKVNWLLVISLTAMNGNICWI